MKVLKYTTEEGGKWKKVKDKKLSSQDIFSTQLIKHWDKGFLWGFIHSFIQEDGKRFDAYNDGYKAWIEYETIES